MRPVGWEEQQLCWVEVCQVDHLCASNRYLGCDGPRFLAISESFVRTSCLLTTWKVKISFMFSWLKSAFFSQARPHHKEFQLTGVGKKGYFGMDEGLPKKETPGMEVL